MQAGKRQSGHAGSAVGTARTRAVPRQPARMVLRFADLDRSSTCSLPSVGLHRPASRESRLAVRQLHRRWQRVRTDGTAAAAPAQCAMCRCRPTHRTDHGIDLEGSAAGATSASGWSVDMPQASRSCPYGRPPPTLASLQKRCADAVQTQSRFSLHTHRPATG